jgi:diketogulonate reductase-like aldo/keto reductase
VNFARHNGIITSCFSPFAGQKADGATLIHDPTVKKLAEKNNMGVGQLLQSWAVQRGTVPLGKSGNAGKQCSFERIMAAVSDNHYRANQSKLFSSKAIRRGQGNT